MSSELVTRLHAAAERAGAYADAFANHEDNDGGPNCLLADVAGEKSDDREAILEAAARIEALEKALEPFAKLADGFESFDGQHDFSDEHVVFGGFGSAFPAITVGHLRTARALLARESGG